MSLIIKGMEMSKSCEDCPLVEETENYYGDTMSRECNLIYKGYTSEAPKGGRLPDCPLVPLPEKHGRLIDADAFKAMCLSATKEAKPDFIRHEDWLKSCAVTISFCKDIDEQPTIVPAEGGGE